jgi:methylmalonyl-CoA/ethylmalonyl-CoA epimerase
VEKLNFFGKDAKFEHVGLVVPSIDKAIKNIDTTTDLTQKVSIAFVSINGIKIELIEPLAGDSPVNQSLIKGQKLLHICFKTPDIEASIKEARNYGLHCIAKPIPAKAFDNNKIAWLYSRIYGLFELLEE